MSENDRVSDSFLISKVEHYNDLVGTLNDLFSGLAGSAESLFETYVIEYEEDPIVEYDTSYSHNRHNNSVLNDAGVQQELQHDVASDHAGESSTDLTERDLSDNSITDTTEVVDAEPSTDYVDKLSEESTERMNEVLEEYQSNVSLDISLRDPEEDKPISVMDAEEDEVSDDSEQGVVQTETLEPSEGVSASDDDSSKSHGYEYMKLTADDQVVNKDPMQIVDVMTAVEKEGITGRKSHDIPMEDVLSHNIHSTPLFDNVIDDELSSQMVNVPAESLSGSDDVSIQQEGDDVTHDEDTDENGLVSNEDIQLL